MSIRAPKGLTLSLPPRWPGPTSNSKPRKPRTMPANTRGRGRVPPGRNQSSRTIHKDTVATRSAARPEGTNFSAQETIPLPTARSETPVTAQVIHSGRGWFLLAGKTEKRIENEPDGEVAKRRHEQGRNRLHSNADGKIGGAPDEIDRRECHGEQQRRWARTSIGRSGQGRRFRCLCGVGTHELSLK